ncbi:MAG: TPM domain-containing protein [Clostridia bacterium]|nr:TPM domain-containing protein [Clostridia bacterium]
MKKNYLVLLFVLIFSMCFSVSAFASSDSFGSDSQARVIDDADILSDSEEEDLLDYADSVSEEYEFDIVIVTTGSLGGKSPMSYADDYFDYNGYGYGDTTDGILFLVSMEDRDWWMSTSGYGITAFTDAGLEYIDEQVIDYLNDGDYKEAFDEFIRICDDFLEQAEKGEPYDYSNLPKELLSWLWIPGSILIGLVIAFICVGVMKSKLRTVRSQPAANSYVKAGSMQLREQRDLFLYRTVTKRPKPKNSGSGSGGSRTHSSSSGSSHGGRGGKF